MSVNPDSHHQLLSGLSHEWIYSVTVNSTEFWRLQFQYSSPSSEFCLGGEVRWNLTGKNALEILDFVESHLLILIRAAGFLRRAKILLLLTNFSFVCIVLEKGVRQIFPLFDVI